jgi:hypothetical protein
MFSCYHLCIENKCLAITYHFVELTLVHKYRESGNRVRALGIAVWLANGWPNGIVHAHRRFGYGK